MNLNPKSNKEFVMKLMSKIAVASLASTLTVSAMAEVTQPALTTPSTEAIVF